MRCYGVPLAFWGREIFEEIGRKPGKVLSLNALGILTQVSMREESDYLIIEEMNEKPRDVLVQARDGALLTR